MPLQTSKKHRKIVLFRTILCMFLICSYILPFDRRIPPKKGNTQEKQSINMVFGCKTLDFHAKIGKHRTWLIVGAILCFSNYFLMLYPIFLNREKFEKHGIQTGFRFETLGFDARFQKTRTTSCPSRHNAIIFRVSHKLGSSRFRHYANYRT